MAGPAGGRRSGHGIDRTVLEAGVGNDTRNVLDEGVTVGEKRDGKQAKGRLFTNDRAGDGTAQIAPEATYASPAGVGMRVDMNVRWFRPARWAHPTPHPLFVAATQIGRASCRER